MRLFVVAAILFASCQGQSTPPAAVGKTYEVTGKVVALDPANKVVKLDHKDIPGLMKAMEMEFDVADANVLDGLKPGDAVRGKLTAGDGYTIISLEKQ